MTESAKLQEKINQHTARAEGLRAAIYTQPDPAGSDDLLAQLAEAEADLDSARQELAAAKQAEGGTEKPDKGKPAASKGRMLGRETTELEVNCTLRMDPIPTGAYHLMNPETDPLLTVMVENSSRETRRVCVKSYLEGLSAVAVKTIEIKPKETAEFDMQPTLFPERAHAITEIQRATLHVIVEDMGGRDGKDKFHPSFIESHNTYHVNCLARTASFNAVRRPDTGEMLDLSHYYGAWVTPHVAPVQERIRDAVEMAPDRRLLGYQGDPEQVTGQVAALYGSLKKTDIVYVNSVIDYGASVGMTTQRTRLPRESIEMRSANCIDGTVLLASLMEGISLNPGIVLIPGHAFLAWEAWPGSDDWRFLETTMIGSSDFEAACKSGQRQHEQFSKFKKDKIKIHSVADLRSRGIWPME